MTPSSLLRSVRQKSSTVGFQRRIDVPAIAAGAERQYDVDTSSDIQALLRRFGSGNFLTVVNLDAEPVEVRLDYMPGRALYAPAGSVVTEDDTMFQAFSIRNIGAAATVAGRVIITFGNVRLGAKGLPVDGPRRLY